MGGTSGPLLRTRRSHVRVVLGAPIETAISGAAQGSRRFCFATRLQREGCRSSGYCSSAWDWWLVLVTCAPQKLTARRFPGGNGGGVRRAEHWQRRDAQAAGCGRSAMPAETIRPAVPGLTAECGRSPLSWGIHSDNTRRRCRSWSGIIQSRHSPSGPDESLAVPVDLRRADGCLQCAQRHATQRIVNRGPEDAVAIVHDEAIGSVDRKAIPELLDRPFSRGGAGSGSNAQSAELQCRG
jgi:hypothetical protein